MVNSRHDKTDESSTGGAEGTPRDFNAATGQSRIILEAIQPTISELRGEIAEVGKKADRHLLYLLAAFAGGFLILAGMSIEGYLNLSSTEHSDYQLLDTQAQTSSTSLASQLAALNDGLTRVSTQISDMLGQKPQSNTAK